MKRCYKCKEWKDLCEFGNDKSRKDGLSSLCKECMKLKNKKYRETHKEYISNYRKNFYQENIDEMKEKDRKNYIKNRDKIKNRKLRYYYKNREKIIKQKRNDYALNKTEILKHIKIRNEKQKERYWARNTIYDHKKKGNNVNVSIEYIENMAKETKYCPICGCKLDWEYGSKLNAATPTLDRIYNENDLNKDNVWIICLRCNATKGDQNIDDFLNK